jgi:signal transduction histidine kinase
MKLKQFLMDHREQLQLVYGIFLIVLIPSLIAFNTISIIGKYNESMDMTLQRHALSSGRSVYSFLQGDLEDAARLQEKIAAVMARNTEFQSIDILVPENEGFKVVASSAPDHLGDVSDFYYYTVAWKQRDNDGLATDSVRLSASGSTASRLGTTEQEGRFWIVAMPMQDGSGQRKAILSIRVSSQIVDDLTRANQDSAGQILLLTILITVFFLLVTVKVWDYALLYNKIKEVDQLKDKFISMASHELRTPLTAIKGFVETAEDEVSPEGKRYLGIIKRHTERLINIVEDLLQLSSLEEKSIKLEMSRINLKEILDNTLKVFETKAKQKNITITVEVQDNLQPINADHFRIEQMLINLIDNALKYTEKGKITVSLHQESKQTTVMVSDTGIGIAKEHIPYIFERFYVADKSRSRKLGGTGLGLSIVKHIVLLHKGTIQVESELNNGTRFTIALPHI